MNVLSRIAFAALLAAAGFAAAPSQAATCSAANVTGSTACQAKMPLGTGAAAMNAFKGGTGVFGVTGWTDLGKISTGDEDGAFADGFLSLTTANSHSNGAWSLAPGFKLAKGGVYALVLEGCKDTVAYLLDGISTSGAWANLDLRGKNGKKVTELHGATLVGTASPAPVPLPAAAWLLLGGLASFGAVSRRRPAA
jgi:hypothetical protein